MRKAIAIAAVFGISCIAALVPAGGGAITITGCSECVPLSVDARLKPTELPQHEYAPAQMLLHLVVNTRLAPTPLRLVTVEFDRDAAIDPIGLPACGRKELEAAQSTSAARAACPGSVVGGGRFLLGAPGNDFFPISFFAFNGGVRDGATVIYLRSQPEGAARPDLAAVSIRAIEGGRYGLRATVHVPRLSGAQLVDFSLRIGRRFSDEGERQSFALARCTSGTLQVKARGLFEDGSEEAVTFSKPCTPK